MIGVNFTTPPGIKRKKNIGLELPNDTSNLTPELEGRFDLTIRIAIQEGDCLDPKHFRSFSLFSFSDLSGFFGSPIFVISPFLATCDEEIVNVTAFLNKERYCTSSYEFRIIWVCQDKQYTFTARRQ